MAAQVHKLLKNFVWRIKAITGLSTELKMPTRFRDYDPLRDTPKASNGWARRFYVDWSGGERNTAATDHARREANHEVHVVVQYPAVYPHQDLQVVIAQDLHLLDKELRRPSNHVGWDDDNSTTSINLYRRQKTADGYSITKDGEVWELRIPYLCKMREVEGT